MEPAGMEEETKTTMTTTTTTPEGENRSKRKMKTASQLEILEKTYSEETYPSEALRVELSAKLGLSDRQLQMWFCHRRLKDRKAPSVKRSLKDSPAAASPGVAIMAPKSAVVAEDVMLGGGELGNEHVLGSGSGSSRFGHGVDSRRVVPRAGVAMARIGADVSAMRRYYEPQQSIIELRAIAFVEAQLGETLREDGPILGMEFDPLPPDAFGALIGTVGQQKQTGQPYETKIYERPDAKSAKGAARALHEYQFLPEQPTVRTDSYERGAPSHYYGSPADGPSSRVQSLSTGRSFMHGNEQSPSGYGFQGRIPSLNLLPQQGMQGHAMSSALGDYDSVPRKNSFTSIGGMDALFGPLSVTAVDNPFISSERRVSLDEDVSRMERKRKFPWQGDEARIAREVEAHEKRIRKELERQDILRRKREEQMRKEMERHDRERRKEEERLLREKQREEERYQREQRRELERKEKFLQKESIRVERVRQKEELRREKEAARLKAANERAIARRIAKESTELIEDERLELMELAASSKGLPSILALDYETLQNLELFRDLLSVFPPRSVPLKKPFAVQPWTDSEENTGNLLMVWRFIITFADVLGLWPFTLDEFVQAFHDYDSRLLGEIHMALLRSIIKDIEDVARTPSSGLGTNQNTAANPGGGHPQIVEGAYAWGFDIRSWQRNLNPLTWPEILRQFSLSAGFGPKLKKRNVDPTYVRDDNDGNNGEDVISNLRNGVAAGKAVAIMQERGYSHPRRSKNRLTPGTVKFAAFHVLSLEGSVGLTILEVADKIQRSGLRDLTTSKTPEASIAAALSRDGNLFERTAPSTYCIRPAYRKNPADAEAILSAARERIRVFKSGFLDGEEAEDVERDEDSESDVAEDPEVDDLGNESNLKKEAKHSLDADKVCAKINLENGMETPEKIMENLKGDIGNVSDSIPSMHSEGFNMVKSASAATEKSTDVDVGSKEAATPDQEDTDIDESNSGEAWVQGLIDGEYSDLSVEERLIALVALIGVAVEGNSIRIVLEERLEAANALKKQMWAEAQLDKRRIKDEYVMKVQLPSFVGSKTDPSLMTLTAEVKQSPMAALDEKNNALSVIPSMQQEPFSDLQNDNSYLDNVPSDRNLLMQDFSAGLDNLPLQQPGLVAERSRSQLKSYIGHKAEEMYVYRSLPLGQDRRRNRYWQFMASASRNDPGSGRIFVELREGCWRLIDSEETFDALLSSLDVRGMRESHLHSMLQKVETSFKESVKRSLPCSNICSQTEHFIKREASEIDPRPVCSVDTDSPSSSVCIPNSELEPSSSFSIELGQNEAEKINAFKRYQEFQKWMWKECLSASNFCAMKYGKKRSMQLLGKCDCCHSTYFYEDKHCPSCHNTFGYFNNNVIFSEHVAQCERKVKLDPAWSLHGSDPCPLRIRLLKVLLALIEVSIPLEALQPVWMDDYRKSWGMKLWNLSSADDLLQILAMLENAIKREHLSLNFETTFELLGSCNPAIKQPAGPEIVPVLPWVPQTTAAVALRLMELDASISYMLHQKLESQKDNGAGDYIKLPSKYAVVKNFQEDGFAEALHETEILQEDWLDPAIGYSSLGSGRGGCGRDRNRTRGGRSQRRVNNSRPGSGRRGAAANTESFGQLVGWKRRTRGQGGRRRGRRTARSRQKPAKRVLASVGKRDAPEESIFERTPEILGRDEWNVEITEMQVEGAENASSSERSEYGDYNGQGTGDEYKDLAIDDFAGVYNGKSLEIFEASDDNVNDNEDDDINYEDEEDEEDVDGDEDEQADIDIGGFINGYSDEEDNMDEDARQNGVPGEGTGSTSSDYSD